MSLAAAIWDTIGELVVWARAKADEVGGRGQVDVAGDDSASETRQDVEHLALAGFYSVIASSDEVLILRRDDGGVTIGARTARPSGATSGDRGILTASTHVRIRGAMCSVLKVTASAPKAVALHNDDCNRNATMEAWMTEVTAAINAIAPGAVTPFVGSSIADVQATSVRLEAD